MSKRTISAFEQRTRKLIAKKAYHKGAADVRLAAWTESTTDPRDCVIDLACGEYDRDPAVGMGTERVSFVEAALFDLELDPLTSPERTKLGKGQR
ncbi:hypothetical protein LCGC14_2961280 [marine sediment metagenome]|uniref:Uncharacterized protein n=1 Tax=marine sediment metagenome TaxID=412755 RepID=A0A0F8XZH0_9ZZZZ